MSKWIIYIMSSIIQLYIFEILFLENVKSKLSTNNDVLSLAFENSNQFWHNYVFGIYKKLTCNFCIHLMTDV